jgi:hypothetical protein
MPVMVSLPIVSDIFLKRPKAVFSFEYHNSEDDEATFLSEPYKELVRSKLYSKRIEIDNVLW